MKWNKKDIDPERLQALRDRYGLDALTASILIRRGITEGEEILYFLEDDPRYLHNPFLFSAMEDAVDRILSAAEEGEKVMIFGDRDADGITATCVMMRALSELGIKASWRLPRGEEPYGLSLAAVQDFAAEGGSLIITVDNGISCVAEVARAGELGIDVIVLDHHNAPEVLPAALAIIDPKLGDSGYPFRDLSGCAVAWKVSQALRFARSSLYKQQVCLLCCRPVNDAIAVEAVKYSNCVPGKRLTEFIVPGALDLSRTRLPAFLGDQQIMVWDAPLQKKFLSSVFGPGAEVSLFDVAPEIQAAIPSARGMSLLRLSEMSRIAKYRGAGESAELSAFENIFVSYVFSRSQALSEPDEAELQLVALSTIADMMPLRSENRILVRRGLKSLADRPRPGLSELLQALGMAKRGARITAKEVSWQLSPAINAAGRMGKPEKAAELLLCEDPKRRAELASELLSMNDERRQLGAEAWEAVRPEAEASVASFSGKLALVSRPDIHRGITGIMASRISKYLDLPACVITLAEDGTMVGSMRSARAVNVRSLLEACSELFIDFGGHDYAAGFSLRAESFGELKARLARLSADIALEGEGEEEAVEVDAELPLSWLRPQIVELAERFEPVGADNEALVFMAKGLRVKSVEIIGKKDPQHLRLSLDTGELTWPAVFWQAAERAEREIQAKAKIDILFHAGRDNWNGADNPRLVLIDARPSEGQAR